MCKQIFLTGKYGAGKYAWVDDEDYDRLARFSWTLGRAGYPMRGYRENGIYKTQYLHREVLACPEGRVVDHIDRNKLNSCSDNLRITTQEINTLNMGQRSDGVWGRNIHYDPARSKFYIKVRFRGKQNHGGYYDTLRDAIDVVDDFRFKVYGADIYKELYR